MSKAKMNDEVKVFTLNDCVTMRICYERTEAPMAIKRSIRPFIKAINNALKEASVKYAEIAKEYLGDKDPKTMTEEEQKAFSNHMNVSIFKINSEIYPAIDLNRSSTLNFFVRFWTPFSFKLEIDGEYNLKLADEIDDKVVELYPELEMDMDKEEIVERGTHKEDKQEDVSLEPGTYEEDEREDISVEDESENQEINTDASKLEEELEASK